jgi:TetR/AcrR family transcriptional repressor of lmrAB and yxaGH operons
MENVDMQIAENETPDRPPTKGERTRSALVETTARLLQEQGFAATGLNQIVRESGQPRGSLYFHFPGGKEELAAAAVRAGADVVEAILRRGLAAAESPDAVLVRTAALFADELRNSAFSKGCPVSTVALEATDATPLLQESCAEAYGTWLSLIRDAFIRLGLPADRAPRLATLALSSIEGALLLAKTTRDIGPLEDVAADLSPLLKV